MQLQPSANFTLVRQLSNHLDTDTNYVQAVIRNAYTDAIIDTLQLTDKGSQRFKKDWQVSADPSGQGFYISVVTSVYTDSGYTTKNQNYGDEETTYLVQERVLFRGGGGVDASDIRTIIKQELEKLPKPEPITIPKPKEPVDRTSEILEAIRAAKPEPPQPQDTRPIMASLRALLKAVEEKPVTPETDISPILDSIRAESENNGIDFKEMRDLMTAFEQNISSLIQETVHREISQTQFTSTFTTAAQPRTEQQQQQQPVPFDPKTLAL